MSPHLLSAIFRSGDLPFRPRYLAAHFVVSRCRTNPVLAVQVYRHLLRDGGSNYAAELFLSMLTEAQAASPRAIWARHVARMRPSPRPLPN